MSHDPPPHTFVAESRELLRDAENALLTLERSPRDTEAVNAVFRAMHTIKGSSGVYGFDVIVDFTHVMEGVIEEIRADRIAVDEVLVALLLTCCDHISSLVDCLETEDGLALLEAARPSGTDLLRQLGCYCAPTEVPGRVASGGWHISARFGRDVLQHGMDPLSFIRYLSTLGEVVSVVTVFDAMPDAQAMDPLACYVGLEIQFSGTVEQQDLADVFEYVRDESTVRILPPYALISAYAELIRSLPEDPARLGQSLIDCGALTPGELHEALQGTDAPTVPTALPGLGTLDTGLSQGSSTRSAAAAAGQSSNERKASDSRFLRVEAGKLDDLISLVGELVIATAGVSLCAQRAADSDLREATAAMGRLVEEVRDGALTLRMVPIGETFGRFNRVVHDLGRELGKDVELVISGADSELDKSMVEKL